jgi:hypothetical protein
MLNKALNDLTNNEWDKIDHFTFFASYVYMSTERCSIYTSSTIDPGDDHCSRWAPEAQSTCELLDVACSP